MSEETKKIVRRVFEDVFSQGKLDVVDELFAPDYVGHDPALAQEIHGPGEFKQFVLMYRNAFPDLQLTIEDQIAEGNLVGTRFRAQGTHRGPLMGIPPTGNKVDITGMSTDRQANGKIVESWTNYDLMGMLQQLDVLGRGRPAESEAEATTPHAS